ncbi:hypothetical protein C8R45DRAFT_1104841 [Mycena sanguinolenta]|nr:hypothetical protein C8R45DRAFT_1104841 [Mycena sanguinolenta]
MSAGFAHLCLDIPRHVYALLLYLDRMGCTGGEVAWRAAFECVAGAGAVAMWWGARLTLCCFAAVPHSLPLPRPSCAPPSLLLFPPRSCFSTGTTAPLPMKDTAHLCRWKKMPSPMQENALHDVVNGRVFDLSPRTSLVPSPAVVPPDSDPFPVHAGRRMSTFGAIFRGRMGARMGYTHDVCLRTAGGAHCAHRGSTNCRCSRGAECAPPWRLPVHSARSRVVSFADGVRSDTTALAVLLAAVLVCDVAVLWDATYGRAIAFASRVERADVLRWGTARVARMTMPRRASVTSHRE